ncbi:MAG: HAD hydrolase-like protein [Saprospirales bacterium]|nr:HAD hydrolase-like protein [Saprospirales bacterium]
MWYFLQEKYNLPFSVDELISMEKQAKYDVLNETDLKPIDRIVDLLVALKQQNYKIAIASSSMKKTLN